MDYIVVCGSARLIYIKIDGVQHILANPDWLRMFG